MCTTIQLNTLNRALLRPLRKDAFQLKPKQQPFELAAMGAYSPAIVDVIGVKWSIGSYLFLSFFC